MKTSNEIKQVVASLFNVHKEMPVIQHNEYSDYGGYGYTSLDKIFEVVKPLLHKNDLMCIQSVGYVESGVLITTRIQHLSGEFIEDSFSIPAVENKKMSIAQELGSAITYAKRYGISALLGIVTDKDNDAQKPHQKQQNNSDYKQLKFKEIQNTLENYESKETIDQYGIQLKKLYPNMTTNQESSIKVMFDKRRSEI